LALSSLIITEFASTNSVIVKVSFVIGYGVGVMVVVVVVVVVVTEGVMDTAVDMVVD
jgi:hypothetical protein